MTVAHSILCVNNLYVNGIPRSFDDPDVWETSPIRILGDLPEGDVTLYGINEPLTGRSGLLLRQGGAGGLLPRPHL